MIFPSVKLDSVVQVSDLSRLDFRGTSTHLGEGVDKIEVKLNDGGWVTAYDPDEGKHNLFIDWMIDVDGVATYSIRFTHGSDVKIIEKEVFITTAEQDKLFSNDEMLCLLEPEIYSLLPDGRISFIYVHRAAQARILRELNEAGVMALTDTVVGLEEASYWSRYLALKMIFEGNVTGLSDIHTQKREYYQGLMESAKRKAIIKLDTTGNGESDTEVKARILPFKLVRV